MNTESTNPSKQNFIDTIEKTTTELSALEIIEKPSNSNMSHSKKDVKDIIKNEYQNILWLTGC